MLGNAGKKLQTMLDTAEKSYERVTQLKERLEATQETVEDTNERVADLEDQVARQGAVLDRLAEAEGIDPDELET